jgi:DNA-directed RNA polymerase subunit RPC12/RpoP
MPTFRCTACGRRVDSPVVIGAGDCPRCGGDVVFDLHRDSPEDELDQGGRPGRGRALLRRLLGR